MADTLDHFQSTPAPHCADSAPVAAILRSTPDATDAGQPTDPGHLSIRHWAQGDRPRERLLEAGASALADAELVALFLGSGTRGRDAISVARSLLARVGGVRGLSASSADRLCAEPGIGPAKSALLLAALELGRRADAASLDRGMPLSDPASAARCLKRRLGGLAQEVFAVLYLDTRHRVLALEEPFRGTIDGATVHPREIVRRALELHAAALIIAHNHPSGIAEPSAQDLSLTRRLTEALALVDVRLLDHFIIGDGEPVSLAERGLHRP
jgi:DNA repair protein RadC